MGKSYIWQIQKNEDIPLSFHHSGETSHPIRADQFGADYVLKAYDLSPKVLARWQKDLNSSKSRQASIKKENESQTVDSLKAEIERLKMMIDDLNAPKQVQKQSQIMDRATAKMKENELLHLVACLIVEIVIKDFDAEFEEEERQAHGLKS